MTTTGQQASLISTLPGHHYTDPELFALEQERIFHTTWFCAVRTADLAEAGQFRTVQAGRESVLVARGRDGGLRAFLNICRHRGARLCTAEFGQVKRSFQCLYHAWTYGTDGKLIAAPNLTSMPDVDRGEHGLVPVALREWLGYAWVCLADDPPSFEEQVVGAVTARLGGAEAIDGYDVGGLALGRRIGYDVRANWKLIVENFMECYHCATIHPELTEVLPEFANGYAAQYYVGHGAEFGPEISGFTVDGTGGFGRLAGIADDQDRRYYAITIRPQVFLNLVPDHVIVHRMFPWRWTARAWSATGCTPRRCSTRATRHLPLGRAVPPGQRAGLRGLRALPAGDELPRLRSRRSPGPLGTPHRRVPRLGPHRPRSPR